VATSNRLVMKISDVEVFVLKTPLDEPFAFSQGWVHQRAATLVKVSTDDGLEGWGEAFVQGLEAPEISAAAISHALKPLVLGENPLDTSVLWHKMYNTTRDHGRKGSVMSAISAIDMALWDIVGKFHQQSIAVLLGGRQRTRIQPYATGFYRLSGQGEASRLVEEALQHKANGFTAMKVKLGFGLADDIAVIQAIGKVIDTHKVDLMVDTNHAYGRADALQLGRVLDELHIAWYEEPVAPEDIGGYAELRSRLDTPIAGGENEHSAYGFNQLFRHDALDIAQPDIGSCGGFTAARDIAAMAQANGVFLNPHVWGSAVAQAASVQFIASLAVAHHSLFPREPLLEFDQSSHPFRQHLVDAPLEMRDGQVEVSNKPGLGIEVQMDTVNQYAN